jgi:hypothetical protein
MQHQLAGVMIELIRVQAADHEPVIRTGGHVWQQIAKVHAATPVLPERALRTHEPRLLLRMKAKRTFFLMLSSSACPFSSLSFGFGS